MMAGGATTVYSIHWPATNKIMQTFILDMHYEELLFTTAQCANQTLFPGAFFHVRSLPGLSSTHWWRRGGEEGIDFCVCVIAHRSASFPWSLKAMGENDTLKIFNTARFLS